MRRLTAAVAFPLRPPDGASLPGLALAGPVEEEEEVGAKEGGMAVREGVEVEEEEGVGMRLMEAWLGLVAVVLAKERSG